MNGSGFLGFRRKGDQRGSDAGFSHESGVYGFVVEGLPMKLRIGLSCRVWVPNSGSTLDATYPKYQT